LKNISFVLLAVQLYSEKYQEYWKKISINSRVLQWMNSLLFKMEIRGTVLVIGQAGIFLEGGFYFAGKVEQSSPSTIWCQSSSTNSNLIIPVRDSIKSRY